MENFCKKNLEFEMARAKVIACNEVVDIPPTPKVKRNVNETSARAIQVAGQVDLCSVHTVHLPVKIPSTSLQTNQPIYNLTYSNKLDSQSKQLKYTDAHSARHFCVLPNGSQPAYKGFRKIRSMKDCNLTEVQVLNHHLAGLPLSQIFKLRKNVSM